MKEIPTGENDKNTSKSLVFLDHIGGKPSEKGGVLTV